MCCKLEFLTHDLFRHIFCSKLDARFQKRLTLIPPLFTCPENVVCLLHLLHIFTDYFMFQFQSFSIYRCKISKKPADEIDVLRANPKVLSNNKHTESQP